MVDFGLHANLQTFASVSWPRRIVVIDKQNSFHARIWWICSYWSHLSYSRFCNIFYHLISHHCGQVVRVVCCSVCFFLQICLNGRSSEFLILYLTCWKINKVFSSFSGYLAQLYNYNPPLQPSFFLSFIIFIFFSSTCEHSRHPLRPRAGVLFFYPKCVYPEDRSWIDVLWVVVKRMGVHDKPKERSHVSDTWTGEFGSNNYTNQARRLKLMIVSMRFFC